MEVGTAGEVVVEDNLSTKEDEKQTSTCPPDPVSVTVTSEEKEKTMMMKEVDEEEDKMEVDEDEDQGATGPSEIVVGGPGTENKEEDKEPSTTPMEVEGAAGHSVVGSEELDKNEEGVESEKSVVVPLSSPQIPSLTVGNKPADTNTATTGICKVSQVSNKEIHPSASPPHPQGTGEESQQGNKLLLACTKSLSSALANKPSSSGATTTEEVRGKRKQQGKCSNAGCKSNHKDLIIAGREAILYFNFAMSYKKTHKICTVCNCEAIEFVKNTTNAVVGGGDVFAFKPKPQGTDGDIIEVKEDEEDDDPEDVRRLQQYEQEKIEVNIVDLQEMIEKLLSVKVDLIEKSECTAWEESAEYEKGFSEFEKEIAAIEQQVADTKKIYDQVTGYFQPVPMVMEEVDIIAQGVIRKKACSNAHLRAQRYIANKKMADINREEKEKQKADGNKADDGEVMVESTRPLQSCPLLKPPENMPHVLPAVGTHVYAQGKTLLHFWLKAEVTEIIQIGPGKPQEYIIRTEKRGGGASRHLKKQVTAKQMAYNLPCPFKLVVGTRIIAKFIDELKTEPAGDGQFYAGIVAESPSSQNGFRYLIFFDDGYAQYVHYNDVLLIYDSSRDVWKDVYADVSDFIQNYVTKYPERPMVRMSVGQVVTTEWNGKWWVARVTELDCSLVKMKFESDGRMEWIYRGSTRLSPLFQKKIQKTRTSERRRTNVMKDKGQPRVVYTYEDEGRNDNLSEREKTKLKPQKANQTARKSTSSSSSSVPSDKHVEKDFGHIRRLAKLDYGEYEGSIIRRSIPSTAPTTKEYKPHECNASCVHEYEESNKEYKRMNPLAIPLHHGFSREVSRIPRRTVHYRGPCGLRLRDLEEVYDYLAQTKCTVPIDHFCFDLAVDCLNEFKHAKQHSFLPDLTYGKENVPVQVVNAFDYEYPPYVEYSSQRIPGAGVHLNTDPEFLVGCDCEDDCRDPSKCSCHQMTEAGIAFTKLSHEEYPTKGYAYRRLTEHVLSGIYECNPKCKCAKTCCNKVVQNGLKVPLQVFKTAAKGWGIRPLFDIPEGAFICIYAGQVLTDAGANEDGKQFGDEYLAELDFLESLEGVKAEYESDVTDIETEEPGERSSKRNSKKEKRKGSDDEIDYHADDSSYRGPKPTTERTMGTRFKNGRSNSSGSANAQYNSDSDDDEDDGGARPKSHFNADVAGASYKENKNERRPLRQYYEQGEECYIMDAKTTGNIGRYLNHSCNPNVFVQNVFVDTHDLRFPWVAFFASKHIKAGSELTWDYNYEIGSVPSKVLFCYCGSLECRGRLL